jgi:small subunit ribosomal protein SAe
MSQIPPILHIQPEDIKRMIACSVHLGSENLDQSMTRYVHGRNENGIHIIDIRKTFEKIQLAARVIAAVNNPKDVCVVGLCSATSRQQPFAQRAVLKFAKYIGCHAIAGRFTPGCFTNQVQPNFQEPRLLIASGMLFIRFLFNGLRFRPSQGPPAYLGSLLCQFASHCFLQHQLEPEKR